MNFFFFFTCNVDIVSAHDVILGEIQTINTILPFPKRQSLKTLVNFEFLKGICVLALKLQS